MGRRQSDRRLVRTPGLIHLPDQPRFVQSPFLTKPTYGHSDHTVIDVRWLARFERAGLVCLALTGSIALVGLFGWLAGVPVLTAGPGLGEIRPTQPWTFLLLFTGVIGIRTTLFKSPPHRSGRLLLTIVSMFCVAFAFISGLADPNTIPAWLRLVPEGSATSGLLATNQAFVLGAVGIGGLLVSSSSLTSVCSASPWHRSPPSCRRSCSPRSHMAIET